MKAQITFKVINPDFNQKAANEYNFGKESDNNWKYIREHGFKILDVDSVELIENGSFELKATLQDGNAIEMTIPNMAIFRFHKENGTSLDFAVSKSILNKTHQVHNEKYKITRCYLYINSEPESIALTDNLVMNVNEIPNELK